MSLNKGNTVIDVKLVLGKALAWTTDNDRQNAIAPITGSLILCMPGLLYLLELELNHDLQNRAYLHIACHKRKPLLPYFEVSVVSSGNL